MKFIYTTTYCWQSNIEQARIFTYRSLFGTVTTSNEVLINKKNKNLYGEEVSI